jgi:hypothetical protein
MATVAGLVITVNSSTSQADIDTALTAAAIDPTDYLDAVVLVEEDANRPAKVLILYSDAGTYQDAE